METIQTKDVEAMMNEVRESLSSPIEFDTIGEIQILMASIRQNYEIREITMQRGVREQANGNSSTLALVVMPQLWKNLRINGKRRKHTQTLADLKMRKTSYFDNASCTREKLLNLKEKKCSKLPPKRTLPP